MSNRRLVLVITILAVTQVAIALILTAAFAKPASASVKWNGTTVTVEEHVNGNYDSALRSSVAMVDQYTGSRMVFGKCGNRFRSHCIIIRHGTVAGNATGHTSVQGWIAYITIQSNIPGWYDRRAVFDHELGHAFFAQHNARCTSRMYPYRRCVSGHLSPRTFLASERARMARY